MMKVVRFLLLVVASAAIVPTITALTEWGKAGPYGMDRLENKIGYPIGLAVIVLTLSYSYKRF